MKHAQQESAESRNTEMRKLATTVQYTLIRKLEEYFLSYLENVKENVKDVTKQTFTLKPNSNSIQGWGTLFGFNQG